ncbi:hypothetical protein OsJ_32467 [Oryza sativa Japonica Group]|uniref:Uncharacterized protein n=1 Tax=Oryza sativa subsp. japonica TaxID=39947 RepID=B9G705_ORYSJ|nr:hypothetical protein OsJ_32467 [Oryza sativa Japonica Group]
MAVAQASLLQSFPFRAAVFAACVLLLPLVPSPQAPAAGGDGSCGGGRGEAFLAKVWELLHLLVVGIAVSYGLFSRRNNAGRRGDEKDAAAQAKADSAGYVSQMIHDSLVFDDGGGDVALDSPGGNRVRSWSAMHHPDEPVVVVATGGAGGGRSHAVEAAQQGAAAVAARKNTEAAGRVVLQRGLRRRRRAVRRVGAEPPLRPSPKRLSPASSLSKETLAKASEDYSSRRRSPYKSSPPAPPPPPPPFLVHGYHPPAAERRTAAKSFKEELQEQTSHSFTTSEFSRSSSNSSSAKPRISIDSSSSSSSYYPVAKSVRTIRGGRESLQSQSQEQPDVAVAGDAPALLHGSDSDDPYGGYRAYQSIPRFQYERGSSDPILGNVTVSSESSDDDDSDVDGDGELSTRGNSPRRESSPEVDENEVDKKAEEFIARFREQIRLQRIESIKKSAGPRGVKHGK